MDAAPARTQDHGLAPKPCPGCEPGFLGASAGWSRRDAALRTRVGGATGRDDLRRHLADVAAHLPADLAFVRLSRTVDRFRVVDEERVTFTHDQELRWLLPGVAPTGRRAEVLAVSVATVRQGRLLGLRTLWDLTTLLAGLGLPADAVRPAQVALGGEGPRGWW